MHDGFNNRYSFALKKVHVVLLSLSPKQLLEDQLKKNKKEMVEKKSGEKSMVAIEKKEKKIKNKRPRKMHVWPNKAN